MNLKKLETFAIVERTEYGVASVSVDLGARITSIVPQWGRMQVSSMKVSEGRLCVTLEDFPFEPLEGTGSLFEVLSLISSQSKIVIIGDGFTIRGNPDPIKSLMIGLLGAEVVHCSGFKDEDDPSNGFIKIRLKSTKGKE